MIWQEIPLGLCHIADSVVAEEVVDVMVEEVVGDVMAGDVMWWRR